MKIEMDIEMDAEDIIELLKDNEVPLTVNNVMDLKTFLEENMENNVREHIINELNYFARETDQWQRGEE